jgi:hypothetical protein
MAVDLDKLALHSSYNSFKNNSVQRNNLVIPASVGAGSVYTNTVSFTLTNPAAFIQGYSYATDYGDYFLYLDSAYHDAWRVVNENADYLLRSSSGLLSYTIKMQIVGNVVSFTMRLSRAGFGAVTIFHDTYLIPITFIDYQLAN